MPLEWQTILENNISKIEQQQNPRAVLNALNILVDKNKNKEKYMMDLSLPTNSKLCLANGKCYLYCY